MLKGRRPVRQVAALIAVTGLVLVGAACGGDEPESSSSSKSSANGTPDSSDSSGSEDSDGAENRDGAKGSGDTGASTDSDTKPRSDAGSGSKDAPKEADGDRGRTSTPVPDDPNADPEDGVVIRPNSDTTCAEVAEQPAGKLDGQCTMAGGKKGSAYSVDCTDGRRLWFVGDGSKSYFGFEGKRYQEWDNETNYAGYERAMNSCES